jgi:flagellar biosynthetic protein FliQ
MNEADALDLIQYAIWTTIVSAGPAVAAAMVVGLIVALLQALTQVQEMTLTFVPKIVVVFLVVSLTASFVGNRFYAFTETVYSRIQTGF